MSKKDEAVKIQAAIQKKDKQISLLRLILKMILKVKEAKEQNREEKEWKLIEKNFN